MFEGVKEKRECLGDGSDVWINVKRELN